MKTYEVIVVGAGQAGLAIGYYLKQRGISCLLLDKHKQIGEAWRKRYDSLVLFTPREQCDLPGLPFPGERNGLPTKDDVADYLELYARRHSLPIQLDTEVQALLPLETGYRLITSQGDYASRQVVIATGPFQVPIIPQMHKRAADDLVQLHTAHYKNESQLKDGPVLVVGSGNSGAQIAAELASSRTVFLSMGQKRMFLPRTLFGKPVFRYFQATGLLTAPITSRTGKWLRSRPDPIFGYRRELEKQEKAGTLQMKERTVDLSGRTVVFADGSRSDISNVIWGTGFSFSYEWINVPGVLDSQGLPIHTRGVSPVRGLYFLGLPWQYCRSSALLGGVGDDAAYLLDFICQY
ncbi:flavin-containing monooxygenase [Brevibacillus borstelensis]|uniref:flavin-containing monooxygenase n=1 Tax=Brevibacillus borstelensis TaxID=45462 RepID=UPI0030C0FDE4